MSTPQLVRYFDLAGAVDPDPIVAQPARDAYGDLVTGFGQRVSIDAWVVDAAGTKVPPAGLEIDIVIAWVYRVEVDPEPPGGLRKTNDMWSRASVVLSVTPGEEITQAQLGDVVGFTAVVTAKSASPAGLRLAIYAVLGPRS